MTTSVPTSQQAGPAGPAADALAKSYGYCRDLTKRLATNFYYGMKLLPEPKRSAMYALYAYMRLVDDIADDDAKLRTLEQRRSDLDQWERLTNEAIAGRHSQELGGDGASPLWPAFADMVRAYGVPAKIFEDMIAGQRQDLEAVTVHTFDDLYCYCYRVASVVGMASLYIWGFEGGEDTLKLSIDRGIAFQLTNVLRDLREDSLRGRCYLPTEELAKFNITVAGISTPALAHSKNFRELMEYQIERARSYYARSAPLESKIKADSRPTLIAMTAIYHGILAKIAKHPGCVLTHRVRLSTFSKLLIGWRAMRGG